MHKTAIVSRSFWPENPAIGEALLLLAESLSESSNPIVITQVAKYFPTRLKAAERGSGVKFSTLPSFTSSSSHMLLRVFELLVFTVFVFISLCWHRPSIVYVATNPPIFTPLAVRWYCRLFKKRYIYHLQDIHPEATQVVTTKQNWLTRLLLRIDIQNTIKAATVITLTEQMRSYVIKRTGAVPPIVLLDNPSVQGEALNEEIEPIRQKGFVYCGNAGRLQRIPLLIAAIERYLKEGGRLPFVFAGGGVYSDSIKSLAKNFEQVSYLGILPAADAAKLLRSYSFGLMPIDDEVTNYAFPSKSSSYIFSGCQVIAICSENTSVANWVIVNKLGFVAMPDIDSIVDLFHDLEKRPALEYKINNDILDRLTPLAHAKNLEKIILELT